MAINYSAELRNAQLDAIEAKLLVGGNPRLFFYTGAKPANCAAVDPAGSVVTAGIDMGANPFAVGGSPTPGRIVLTAPINGTFSPGGGPIASFRIKSGAGTCHIQGTVGTSGADINLDALTPADGQAVQITQINIDAANA